jgi:hypothetical protein
MSMPENLNELNERGLALVIEARKEKVREFGHRLFPDGSVRPYHRVVEIPYQLSWFDSGGYQCSRSDFADGRVFEEFIQAHSATSKYHELVYLALKDGSGEIIESSLWTDEEIAEREEVYSRMVSRVLKVTASYSNPAEAVR